MTENKVPRIDNEYLKEKRKKQLVKRRRRQRYIVIVLLIVVILILLYMFTPISKIKDAEIHGNHYISDQEITKALKINKHPRIYAYAASDAEQRIEKEDLVDTVSIHKGLFNHLTVDVKEHEIIGVTSEKSKTVPIIESGKVLKDFKGEIPNEAPYLEGFKGDDKKDIITALHKMDRTTRGQISEIVSTPEKNQPDLIKLYMRDGIEVVGKIKTIADKLKYYPSMSQALEKDESGHLKKSGFIDLSVGATFIPYENVKNEKGSSASAKEVQSGTAIEDEAKDDLQKALNKIKDDKDDKDNSDSEETKDNPKDS